MLKNTRQHGVKLETTKMKKISAFFLFLSIGVNSFAQESIQKKITTVPQPKAVAVNQPLTIENSANKTTTISVRVGEPQVIHNNAYYQREIDKIDAQVAAIDTKINSVNSNPEEKAIAIESGWFDDMERIKLGLENRKTELQRKLN